MNDVDISVNCSENKKIPVLSSQQYLFISHRFSDSHHCMDSKSVHLFSLDMLGEEFQHGSFITQLGNLLHNLAPDA